MNLIIKQKYNDLVIYENHLHAAKVYARAAYNMRPADMVLKEMVSILDPEILTYKLFDTFTLGGRDPLRTKSNGRFLVIKCKDYDSDNLRKK